MAPATATCMAALVMVVVVALTWAARAHIAMLRAAVILVVRATVATRVAHVAATAVVMAEARDLTLVLLAPDHVTAREAAVLAPAAVAAAVGVAAATRQAARATVATRVVTQ